MTPNIQQNRRFLKYAADDPRQQYNDRWIMFQYITGLAMDVYRKFKYGQGADVYVMLLAYLLRKNGLSVERDVQLPMYWDDAPIGDTCDVDMIVHGQSADVVIKVLSQDNIATDDREPFKTRMSLTHTEYSMLINFSPEKLYSEWYHREPSTGIMDKIKLL